MVTCAIASPAAISGIWSRRRRLSFPSLTSAANQIQKDTIQSFRAPKLHVSRDVSLHPVVKEAEHDNEAFAQILNLKKNDDLASVFENVSISGRLVPSSAKTSRKEQNPRRVVSSSVIRYPLGTESAMKAMLEFNTLVFVVDKRAIKTEIKDAFEKMFKIRAKKVNTLITPDGTKKAFVMLARDFNALEVAKRIKML